MKVTELTPYWLSRVVFIFVFILPNENGRFVQQFSINVPHPDRTISTDTSWKRRKTLTYFVVFVSLFVLCNSSDVALLHAIHFHEVKVELQKIEKVRFQNEGAKAFEKQLLFGFINIFHRFRCNQIAFSFNCAQTLSINGGEPGLFTLPGLLN